MSKVLTEHEEAEFALNFTIKQLKEKNTRLRAEASQASNRVIFAEKKIEALEAENARLRGLVLEVGESMTRNCPETSCVTKLCGDCDGSSRYESIEEFEKKIRDEARAEVARLRGLIGEFALEVESIGVTGESEARIKAELVGRMWEAAKGDEKS